MGTLHAVIFDTDGTLVDSNDAHAHAWVAALAEHGYEVEFDEVRVLIGMGGDKLLPALCGLEKETPEGKAISERRAELFEQQYLADLQPFPGVRALFEQIQAQGLRLFIASSAQSEELEKLLDIAGVSDLIEDQTSSSDAEESKPAPDIVQSTLKKIGCTPGETLMIGDTPYDIEAANQAGVPVIALRCGGWNDEGLAGAIAIYDDPADLLAHYADSPLAAEHSASTGGSAA